MKGKTIRIRAITITAITIVVVGVPILIYTLMHAGSTVAAWYNDSWGYRTKLTIDNTKVGGANEVFDIGNETGDLSQYSGTITDSGHLTVSSAAALNGSNFGLNMNITSNTVMEAQKTLNHTTKTNFRFYFDPNSVSMANATSIGISRFIQDGGSYNEIADFNLFYNTGSGYGIEYGAKNDAGSWIIDSTTNISDAPHYLEVSAVQAATSGSSDGSYQFWIDGTSVGSVTGVDNFNLMSDQNWKHILTDNGVGSGTRGTIYFDDFVANSDGSYIGPVLTDFPVYVDLSKIPSNILQHIQSGGGDIRVTKSDGITELPREVVSVNPALKTGELYFKYSGTLSSSTNTSVYIYYGNPAVSDYAASATYGKNNVWDGNFSGVHHLQGNSFNDSTSGAHSATNNGSTNATGNFGDGRQMSADGQYFSVPMSGYVHASVDTFEWWYKSTSTPLTYSSFFNSSEGSSQLTFNRSSSDTTLSLSLNNANFIDWTSLSTNVFDGGWHHIAVVLDTVGNTEELFIDGSSRGQKTQNPANIDISTYNFLWGGNTASAPANGIIDETRVSSNILRSSTWISTEYNDENSPLTFFLSGANEEQKRSAILSFNFDEGYGSTAHDSSPNGYTGTLSGATTPSWQTEDQCISGKCLYYNGSTAYTSVTTSVPNVQSVSFWVKPKTNGETLVDLDGGTHYISASSGTITATGFSGTTVVYVNGQSGGLLTANAWQHVEVTTTTAFTASNITIGKYSSTYLNGFVDEFKVYDYARSSDQVKLDYSARTSKSGTAVHFGPDLGNTLSNGLVGYWKMDETASPSLDSSGNGNSGTWTTSPTYTGGKFGNAINLNNTNGDYISLASTVTLSSNATYAFWIYRDSSSPLWAEILGSDTNHGIFSGQSDAGILEVWNGGATYKLASTSVITASAWHHVVVTDDGTTSRIFVDGVLNNSSTNRIAFDVNKIGQLGSGGTFDFNGYIDDFRLYSRSLSPAEVRQLYTWAPGPIGWWKMDEGSWTNDCSTATVMDSSGNGNNGKSCPSSTGPTGGATGKFGRAGSFDAVDDYVDGGSSTSLDLTNSFTLSTWVYPTDTTHHYQGIITKKSGTATATDGYSLAWDQNVFTAKAENGDAISSVKSANQWYHVAVTYSNGSSLTLYVNGVREASITDPSLSSAGTSLRIGFWHTSNATYGNYFGGKIDDVKVYNYTRTVGQIVEDMNAGHPAPGSPVGSALAYWKMDEGVDNTCSGGVNDVCNSGSAGSTLDGAESSMSVPATSTSGWTNAGKFGKALNFDGINDYVNMGDATALDVTAGEDFTVATWMNTTATANTPFTKIEINSTEAGWGAYINNNKLYLKISNASTHIDTPTTVNINDGVWHHVAFVVNRAGNCIPYVDGASETPVDCSSLNTSDLSNARSFILGANKSGADSWWAGKLDDFRFFNSALTSDQIKVLYNQSSSLVLGAVSTDSSSNASFASQREFCPPGNTEGNCGGSNDPSPVGYWKMDENTGTTAVDSSGNGFNATWAGTGATHWKPGKLGSAGNFNGTDDWAYVPDISSKLNLVSATPPSFTEEAWFYIGASPASGSLAGISLMCDGAGSCTGTNNPNLNGLVRLFYSASDTKIRFQLKSGSTTVDALTTTTLQTWVHAAGVYDSTANKMYLYINGVLQGSATPADRDLSKVGDTMRVAIGESQDYFKGLLDDVRVYSYVRTSAQVAWDYNRGGPVAWWKMDECSGNTLHDSSENRSDATLTVNAGSRVTSAGSCSSGVSTEGWSNGASGKFNSSFDFDSSGPDYGKGSIADYRINDTQGTATAWVKVNAYGANDMYVLVSSDEAGSTHGFGFGVNSAGKPFIEWQNGGTDNNAVSTSAISAGQFHFITWWSDGTQYKIYIDGILQSATYGGSGLNNGAWFSTVSARDNFTIGVVNYSSIGYGFNGLIDDVRLYNYALSTQQLNTVMNQGSAVRFGPLTGSP